MINNFKNITNQGFTLIETFVAITILMITILGPMSLISKFYADSTYSKNQIMASFLAQDGMETVQNIIKNNSAKRRKSFSDSPVVAGEESFTTCENLANVINVNWDWLNGLKDDLTGLNVTSIDSDVVLCRLTKGCPLKKNSSEYYVASADPTGNSIFTRKIVISEATPGVTSFSDGVADDESKLRRSAQVISSVWWSEKGEVHGPVVVSSLIIQNQCP